MKVMITLLFMSFILNKVVFALDSVEQATPNRILILVPGTLNSVVPGPPEQYLNPNDSADPYFSAAIITHFKKNFYAVRVTPKLDLFGDIKKNGRRVYNDTLKWYNQLTENMPKRPEVWMFGHSAGGLYSLYAAHLNNQNNNPLPIKKISMLSTPLDGVEFIDIITQLPFVFEGVAELFLNSTWPLDFRGLWGLKRKNVYTFLNELTLPSYIQIDAFTGTQKSPLEALEVFNVHFLSPPLTLLQRLIKRLSDGIVSKKSALTEHTIASTDGRELRIHSHPELVLPLDHVEQVWDYRYLQALGTLYPEFVLQTQLQSYENMLSIITDPVYVQ
jgi:hypothetical protein